MSMELRAIARPIIGGGDSYIRVMPDGFLLIAIVFTVCEHEYMNIHTPTQLQRLATVLMKLNITVFVSTE